MIGAELFGSHSSKEFAHHRGHLLACVNVRGPRVHLESPSVADRDPGPHMHPRASLPDGF